MKTQHATALKLLSRTNGASVEALCEELGLATPKEARGIIDRLRFRFGRDQQGAYNPAKGKRVIKNIGSHTFRATKGLK